MSTVPGLVEHRQPPSPHAQLEQDIRRTVYTCLQFAGIDPEQCSPGAELATRLVMQLLDEHGWQPPQEAP